MTREFFILILVGLFLVALVIGVVGVVAVVFGRGFKAEVTAKRFGIHTDASKR